MAGADYSCCDRCASRVIYDANLEYENCGDMALLCKKCVGKYRLAVVRKSTGKESKRSMSYPMQIHTLEP